MLVWPIVLFPSGPEDGVLEGVVRPVKVSQVVTPAASDMNFECVVFVVSVGDDKPLLVAKVITMPTDEDSKVTLLSVVASVMTTPLRLAVDGLESVDVVDIFICEVVTATFGVDMEISRIMRELYFAMLLW